MAKMMEGDLIIAAGACLGHICLKLDILHINVCRDADGIKLHTGTVSVINGGCEITIKMPDLQYSRITGSQILSGIILYKPIPANAAICQDNGRVNGDGKRGIGKPIIGGSDLYKGVYGIAIYCILTLYCNTLRVVRIRLG